VHRCIETVFGFRMKLNGFLAFVAIVALATALWELRSEGSGVHSETVEIGRTPATIYRPVSGELGPVVLIAHGFAGSQQLMQSFALTFARNGYIAVTFDFAGHGRNPTPLTGSITDESGATQSLLAEVTRAAEYARGLGNGKLAILGHSMASDIVVRFAQANPDIAATIAVSMFSPVVTATTPHNLLVIVGEWEGMLKQEALRAIGLATAPNDPKAGVTYGAFANGTARRAAFSAHVEHASVLYSQESMQEAVDWLDQAFGTLRTDKPSLDGRGPWILVLFSAVVMLARPLSSLLPPVARPPTGAGLRWRRFWMLLLIPMVVTPIALRVLPTHFLPVLVADYLAAHFATYGLMTAVCLYWVRRQDEAVAEVDSSGRALAAASVAVIIFGFVALGWPIDIFVTSFVPGPERVALIAAMSVGTLLFFLSDEWTTRGPGAERGAYVASKICFLGSLGIAVVLDFERLFFLVIIIPVIVMYFVIYGLFSAWIYRQTGHPFVAGIANAFAFAWAIGVTFPLLAG
jgi:alpha-beta hydrolase superfamily lysophospholipase